MWLVRIFLGLFLLAGFYAWCRIPPSRRGGDVQE